MPRKKKQLSPIPDNKFTEWCDLKIFFEEITKEIVFPEQEQLFKEVEKIDEITDIIICCGRGCGKTWSLAVIALWYAFVLSHVQNRALHVAVLAGSKDESEILFKYLRRILKKFPEIDQYIAQNQRGGTRFTRDYLEFKDTSSIIALPCSMTGVCGHRASLLIVDEAGLKEFKEEVKDEAFEIVTGQPHRRIIMASTPYYYRSPFVTIYMGSKDWRKLHWGQEDCPWIKKEQIEKKRRTLSKQQFDIRILGLPTTLGRTMFNPKDLKEIFKDKKEIHYTDFSARVAGIDWGQNIAQTALVIIEINPVDKKIRVVKTKIWSDPDHSQLITPILQICSNFNVSKIIYDSNPPSAGTALVRKGKFFKGEFKKFIFTGGDGEAAYHNLVRLVERILIEAPNDYSGTRETLLEQMRDMQWAKNPKKRTDLVDALAMACSEDEGFLKFEMQKNPRDVQAEFEAWAEYMRQRHDVNILPQDTLKELTEQEERELPDVLQGDPDEQIWWYDPNLGFLRAMTRKEARKIWIRSGNRKIEKIETTKRGSYS